MDTRASMLSQAMHGHLVHLCVWRVGVCVACANQPYCAHQMGRCIHCGTCRHRLSLDVALATTKISLEGLSYCLRWCVVML